MMAALAAAAAAYCRGCLLDDVKLDAIFWMGGGLARSHLLSLFAPTHITLEVNRRPFGGDGN
jgi:hypothetical protein